MIQIKEYTNSRDFLNENENFMLQAESENNLIIGLAHAMAENKRKFSAPLHFSVIKNDVIVGAAIRTDEDRPLLITRMPIESIEILCEQLISRNIKLAGVVGEALTSEKFAQSYAERRNMSLELAMNQGIYETNEIIVPNTNELKIILSTEENISITSKFIRGFIDDCFPNDKNPQQKAEEMAKRHVQNKTLYLLVNSDNEAISMAANNRETRNTACISLVYTPPKHRKNGYGSIVTALVSQKMLDSGKKYCNLFTDLLNPTSNSIYQKIGYKMIGKSKHFDFKE